jgi:hypothetical protein
MSDETTGTETTTETTEAAADVATVDTTVADTAAAEGGDTSTVLGGEGEATTEAAAEIVVPDTYDLKLADDQPIDAEVLEMATPILKEMKLDQASAQKFMPIAKEIADRSGAAAVAAHVLDQAAAFQAYNKENLENAKGDAEIGGANWDKSVTNAAKALDMLGFPKGSEFRKRLNDTGFGNDPEMIRAFARIGERVSEDVFARTESLPAGKVDRLAARYPEDVPKEGA